MNTPEDYVPDQQKVDKVKQMRNKMNMINRCFDSAIQRKRQELDAGNLGSEG